MITLKTNNSFFTKNTFLKLTALLSVFFSLNVIADTYVGKLDVHMKDYKLGTHKKVYYLRGLNGVSYPLQFSENLNLIKYNLYTGKELRIDAEPVFTKSTNTKINPPTLNVKYIFEPKHSSQYSHRSSITGDSNISSNQSRTLGNIILKFLDTPDDKIVDKAYLKEIMLGNNANDVSLNSLFSTNSNGQINFNLDPNNKGEPHIYGPYFADELKDETTGEINCNFNEWKALAKNIVNNPTNNINESDYQHIVLSIPGNICNWAGASDIGNIAAQETLYSAVLFNEVPIEHKWVYAHEIGHNLGLGHTGVDLNNDGTIENEADDKTIMSSHLRSGVINIAQRDYLSWYQSHSARITTVYDSATFSINALQGDYDQEETQALKILYPNGQGYYYVSFYKDHSIMTPNSDFLHKVSVHRNTGDANSHLVSLINEGNDFVDDINGITINFDSTNNTVVDSTNNTVAVIDVKFDFIQEQDVFTSSEDLYEGSLHNSQSISQDPVEYRLHSSATKGDVSINPDGSFTYTAHAKTSGVDSFTYVKESDAGTRVRIGKINVNINYRPIVSPIQLAANPGETITGNINVTDIDDDEFSFILLNESPQGRFLVNRETGSFTYHAASNSLETETFFVEVSDGKAIARQLLHVKISQTNNSDNSSSSGSFDQVLSLLFFLMALVRAVILNAGTQGGGLKSMPLGKKACR